MGDQGNGCMRWRILVVDDEPDVGHAMRQTITALVPGARVEVATSAHEALAHMQRERPDLVVADHRMPSMDGLEMALQAQRNMPRLPIIVVTAYPAPEIMARAGTRNIRAVLPKPVDPQRLAMAVHKALQEATGAAPT